MMRRRPFLLPAALLGLVALLGPLAAACGGSDGAGAAPVPGPSSASFTTAQLAAGGEQQGISVSGQGTVTLEPDVAVLSLGVSVTAGTARAARDQAAEAMQDLLDSLRANGIDDDDIQTTQLSVGAEYDYSGYGRPRIIGYRVSNTVSVKVRDLDRVADVVDDAVEAVGDVVRINGLTFTLDDPTAALEQARAQAMAEARAKAQQLAELAGVQLGQPIAISESSPGGPPVPFDYRQGLAEFEVGRAPTPIEPGQLQMTVQVFVVYAIG